MTGLQTLATGGLDLAALDSSSTAELLEWHPTAGGQRPDADITVLLWTRDHAGITDWERGWWDGEDWRLAESGGVCAGTVTHWAQPEGPAT